jgi:hypothetical protein
LQKPAGGNAGWLSVFVLTTSGIEQEGAESAEKRPFGRTMSPVLEASVGEFAIIQFSALPATSC